MANDDEDLDELRYASGQAGDALEDLRRWYRGNLRTKRAELVELRQQGGEEAEAGIRRIAHGLRGSGKTYGYPKLTDHARAVERSSPEDLQAELETLLEVIDGITAQDDAD